MNNCVRSPRRLKFEKKREYNSKYLINAVKRFKTIDRAMTESKQLTTKTKQLLLHFIIFYHTENHSNFICIFEWFGSICAFYHSGVDLCERISHIQHSHGTNIKLKINNLLNQSDTCLVEKYRKIIHIRHLNMENGKCIHSNYSF